MRTITCQYSTTQDLHLQLYARVNKQLSLCHYMCTVCHPLLSDLFAGETLSTCATSLAGISRDLAHVVNVSLVNRLESKGRQIVITSECDHCLLNKNLK